jgi:hypothetical protein
MARITVTEAQAWVEGTKFTIVEPLSTTNASLLSQIETEIIARVSSAYDTSAWLNEASTPPLVKVAIAKLFVSWAYRRQYSEAISDEDAAYARFLAANSELIVSSLVDGSIKIPELPGESINVPIFYPTDASSVMEPTLTDPSLGPAKFSMGQVF